jgi:hypothetical protein
MRYLLTRRQPAVNRILLIESGSRQVAEAVVPRFRSIWGDVPIDLLTCFPGTPSALDSNSVIYRVMDYRTSEQRNALIRHLRERRYGIAGMICSAEPIMTKWKWWVALRLPAKFMIINENGDFFWLNREHLSNAGRLVMVRMGLTGAGALRTLPHLLVFPFSLLYLLFYAFAIHGKRALRKLLS